MFKVKRATVNSNTVKKMSDSAMCTRLDGGPMYYMDNPTYWSYGEVQRMVNNTFVAYDTELKQDIAIIALMRDDDADANWKIATFSVAEGLDQIYDARSIYNLAKIMTRKAIEDKTCYTVECTIDYSVKSIEKSNFCYLEYALEELDFKLVSKKGDLKKKYIRTIKPLDQDYYS